MRATTTKGARAQQAVGLGAVALGAWALGAVAVGVLVGGASALWASGFWGGAGLAASGAIDVKGWRGDLTIGSRDAGPYVRAAIAQRGLLALSREETIYFSRDTDDEGARLRPECAYALAGGRLPARWWSVTLYADDDFLARNDDEAHTVSASTPGLDGAMWSARIGASRDGAAHWVSSNAAGAYSLTLRLYNPEPSALAAPEEIALPGLRKLSCDAAVSAPQAGSAGGAS